MRRAKVVWSPVEETYLKEHMDTEPRDQLCIALAKSRSALQKKISELKKIEKGEPIPKKKVGHQSRVGKREDLGFFVRSGWEANMMRYFKSRHSPWGRAKYEPKLFSFTEWEKPKGRALSYSPDFQVTDKKTNKKHWVEVKGNWLRSFDKTKLRRFKKHYPEEFKKLIAVVSSKNTKTAQFFKELGVPDSRIVEYNELKKKYSAKIPHWE
jgi:hypothetical protein